MKTKPYTKNKKNAKNDEWEKSWLNCTMPVKSVRLRKETQLDRIERKLDELLTRPFCPAPWSQPPMPSPWYNNPNAPHPPVDHYGNPTIYCSANGGVR